MVVWIVGLSGSGKTTIGTQLYKQWQKVDPRVVFLDGDEVRRVSTGPRKHQDYSISGRKQNAQRLVRLCELLDQQGFNRGDELTGTAVDGGGEQALGQIA